MRIVLDTNVLISAILWKGLPNRLLRHAEAKRLTFCLTPKLFEELGDVLSRPKFISRILALNTSLEFLAAEVSKIVEMYPDIPLSPVIREDPDDDKVLACAVASGARAVVTGDRHLLRLKSYRNIPILTPQSFARLFEL